MHSGLQQVPDALVSGQHIFHGSGRAAEAGQCAEDILQFLTLSVEDVTQAQFLHGDGGEDLIDCVFPLDGRVNVGKTGQRHKTISFLNEGARHKCAGTAAGKAPYQCGPRNSLCVCCLAGSFWSPSVRSVRACLIS